MPEDNTQLPSADACAAEYWRAGAENRPPMYVPSRVRLDRPIAGDFPIGHQTIASAGEHDCKSNRYGALSVLAGNGSWLGIKPGEFEPTAWRLNEKA